LDFAFFENKSKGLARVLLFHQSQPKYNMKSLKYITLIGLLCAGLTSLARADLVDLGEATLGSSGDDVELAKFIELSGETDAFLCAKIESLGEFSNEFGTFTITDNGDDTITVEFNFTATDFHICGFAVKDGQGNLEHFYQVINDQGTGSGSFILEIPGNGSGAFSHLSVFCCPGGPGVPDGGTTVMLLGAALSTLGVARRFFFKR
jgi:hypothetical protein